MKRKDHNHKNWFSIDERIDFYLNNLTNTTVTLDKTVYHGPKKLDASETILITYRKYANSILNFYCKYLIDKPLFRKIRALPFINYKLILYLGDILPILSGLKSHIKDIPFLFFYGEHGKPPKIPVFKKARRSNDENSLIFKLGKIRHFAPCKQVEKIDVPWEEKKINVVWRGSTTGKSGMRELFVEKYFNNYDIAFSSTKQKPTLNALKKNKLTFNSQLKNKYIISLEGNELASNLKWILYSNSVPIMQKPKWHSWIMEKHLLPYVHYLPLNDNLDNLEELMDWAEKNDEECKEIALNGKHYMSQFLDNENEQKVYKKLLLEYSEKVHIKTP